MSQTPMWRRYLRLRGPDVRQDVEEELSFHLEMRTRELVEAGMSPDAARAEARRNFGDLGMVERELRELGERREHARRRAELFGEFGRDIRNAARQLRANPGFTIVAVLSLALGIGANTAIFGLASDILLKSLPVRNPEELVRFEWLAGREGALPPTVGLEMEAPSMDPATGRPSRRAFSLETFDRFRSETVMLQELVAFAPLYGPTLTIDGQSEVGGLAQVVSGNFHQMLGVSAAVGRTLTTDDDGAGAEPVAVISHRYWQQRFGGNAGVIGKTISVNRARVTIVGVAAEGFNGVLDGGTPTDLFLPLRLGQSVYTNWADRTQPGYWWLSILGRLEQGRTAEEAQARLDAPFRQIAAETAFPTGDLPTLTVSPGGDPYSSQFRREASGPLMTQWTLVALVLLGACANVANLLLARGAARRREIATRLALGARRSRIVRQLLTESVMLACIGTIAGLGLAVWGRGLLLSSEDPLSLDWYVLGFSAIVALSTAVIFGLVPSLRATRLNLAAEFRSGARQLGRGAGLLLNRVIMALQIALSLVLLVGAGLFMRTLGNLHDVDAGFNRDRLLLFSIDAQQAGYVDDGYANLFGDIVSRIEALPGVRSATFSSAPLLSGNRLFAAGVAVPGNIPQSGEEEVVPFNHVAPGFFETMEMPILRGRSLTPADDAGAPRVVVISRGMAAKFFGGEDPVGRSIRIAGVEREVVGVVGDVRYTDLRQSTPVTFYLPIRQEIMGRAQFAVRTEMDPATVAAATRRAVAEIDRNLPIGTLRTQKEALEKLMAQERSLARLATFFGLLALGLTAVGLYGLMSYVTLRRTAEVGLRRALGASSTNLLRTFISESLALWAGGVVLGLAITVVAARLIEGTLFGVPAIDAATYAGVILILLGVTIAAVWVPAWRAAKLDPMVALRQE